MRDNGYKLGVSLVKSNVVEFDILEKALLWKKKQDPNGQTSLAQILVNEFEVDHHKVYREVANLYGFRQLKLSDEPLEDAAVETLRKRIEGLPKHIQTLIASEQVLYLKTDTAAGGKATFIAVDPTNKHIPTIVRAFGVKRHEVCYVSLDDFEKLFTKIFPPENEFLKVLADGDIDLDVSEEPEESALDESAIDSEINKSLLVNLVEGMLIEAVRRGVSDIHVIPKDQTTTEILFRVDGKLRPWHVQTGVRPEALTAVVKDRSRNIDRFERDCSQDGFIQRKIDGHIIRFRVSVIPIVGREFQFKYESIVIRILDDRKVITDLDVLGFHGSARQSFVKAISQPQGMIIVTGPTGSGKSTTLIAALSYIMTPEVNVLTVEDPVEYVISGARQIKINPKNNFDQALRAILRHDPDVVMVGEIRDKKTAETGIKLANTGHLTFSTLHTNDAPSAVSRMFKMGVEPFLIAYAINIIIAQRLMRRLCNKCKEPVKGLDWSIPMRLGFTEDEVSNTTFYKAVGCDKCHGGYKGRAAIHEALFFSKAIRRMIFEAGTEINEEALRDLAIKDGMLTLRAAARERVKEGVASLEELAHTTSDD